MKTWNAYKEHVNATDTEIAKDIQEVESIAASAVAGNDKGTALNLSQQELAVAGAVDENKLMQRGDR